MQLVQGRIASIGGCWRHSAAAAVPHCCYCWTIAASVTVAAAADADAAVVGGDGAGVAGETQW